MNKLICKSNDCIGGCVVDRFEMTPHKCPFISTPKADWQKMVAYLQPDLQDTQPDLQDTHLPKLTAKVFDREDCPADTKIAVVNMNGDASWGSFATATVTHLGGWRGEGNGLWIKIPGKWDAGDWRNSLIERPTKLPDWCKVGEWVYDKAINKYSQVAAEDITEHLQEVCKSISKGEIIQARLRPYNAEEMKALVGKVIKSKEDIALVVGYRGCQNKVIIGMHENHGYFSAEKLLDYNATIDGQPCGVFEHMENGEWVE